MSINSRRKPKKCKFYLPPFFITFSEIVSMNLLVVVRITHIQYFSLVYRARINEWSGFKILYLQNYYCTYCNKWDMKIKKTISSFFFFAIAKSWIGHVGNGVLSLFACGHHDRRILRHVICFREVTSKILILNWHCRKHSRT